MTATPIIFSGSSHPILAKDVVAFLGTSLGKCDLHMFPDHEMFIEILESVQGRDTFVLQSLGENPNIHLMELFIILDALKRAAAASITVVLPYFAYARQDRLDRPGVAITAKLIADLLTTAGANQLITMDLHSEQIEGFFDIPVHQLLSHTLLIPYCAALNLENLVVVAPDKGGIKIASAYARELDVPIALIEKERIDPFRVEMRLFVGDVKGKAVLLPDDMCSTAGTLVNAAQVCAELGAQRIIAVVGHGLFIADALERIQQSPLEMVITTNSIPISDKVRNHPKIRVISIAPLIAGAIGRANFLFRPVGPGSQE
jgi:ribose-phosphate pyrophosphokinase